MAKNGFYRNIIGMIVNGRCGTVMEENIYEKIENALSESGFAKTIFICVYLMKDYRKERLISEINGKLIEIWIIKIIEKFRNIKVFFYFLKSFLLK